MNIEEYYAVKEELKNIPLLVSEGGFDQYLNEFLHFSVSFYKGSIKNQSKLLKLFMKAEEKVYNVSGIYDFNYFLDALYSKQVTIHDDNIYFTSNFLNIG